MQGWFRIELDRAARLIRLTMGGFYDSPTVDRLREALGQAVVELRCPPHAHLTLCDIRDMDIQSQDRVEEFARLVGSGPLRSRRLAFVTAAGLARLQARRLTDREGVDFFTEPQAALAWLREDVPPTRF